MLAGRQLAARAYRLKDARPVARTARRLNRRAANMATALSWIAVTYLEALRQDEAEWAAVSKRKAVRPRSNALLSQGFLFSEYFRASWVGRRADELRAKRIRPQRTGPAGPRSTPLFATCLRVNPLITRGQDHLRQMHGRRRLFVSDSPFRATR